MVNTLLIAIRTTILTGVLCSLLYPLAITGLGQLLFPAEAHGSLISSRAGSELLAQAFSQPGYLQPRPSAAGASGYDASASGGSNLGPTSQKLRDRVTTEVARLKKENSEAPGPIPAELVTTSASGLDPHLSPEAAIWQAPRVARARGVPAARIEELIASQVEGRDWGFLGEQRVNVLRVNLLFDQQLGQQLGKPLH